MKPLRFSAISLSLLAPVLSAQDVRTTATVNERGVFFVDSQAPGTIRRSGPNPSPSGLRWTYPDGSSIVQSVSVGHSGTMGWLGYDLNNRRLSLVATADDNPNPPVPVYEVAQSADIAVRAADKSPFAAVAVNSGSGSTLEYYDTTTNAPLWMVAYNASASSIEVAISDDGRYVAVGWSPSMMTSQVDVYDASSPTPTTAIANLTATTHSMRQIDISGDGSTVLLATQTTNHVFDVATQAEVFQDSSTVSHDAHSINRDGTVWGRGGFNPVRAWVKSGSTYNKVLDFSDNTLGFAVFTAADVSQDGSTFAAAAYDAQNSNRLRVYCWSLTPTGSSLLWMYASDGTGTASTTPTAVSLSDDGKYVAVGNWGTSGNDHPEAMVFDRDAGNVPIVSLDTPGSVYDLDLSGDGQFLVVGTKSVHANTFGRGGEGYSYDLGGQDHWLEGTVGLNRTFRLNTGGTQGQAVFIAFAGALGPPISLPGFNGTLQLDVSQLYTVLTAGSVPASGVNVVSVNVPNSPSLVGQPLYTQAVTAPPFEFENTLLLPIVP